MSVNNVDVERAHVLQTNDSYTYVDVRSAPEYEKGHPAGAYNVPLLQFDVASGQMQPNPDFLSVMQANYARDAKLLVGCQVGGRSAQAAQILASAGYTDVSNVRVGSAVRATRLPASLSTRAGSRSVFPSRPRRPQRELCGAQTDSAPMSGDRT